MDILIRHACNGNYRQHYRQQGEAHKAGYIAYAEYLPLVVGFIEAEAYYRLAYSHGNYRQQPVRYLLYNVVDAHFGGREVGGVDVDEQYYQHFRAERAEREYQRIRKKLFIA